VAAVVVDVAAGDGNVGRRKSWPDVSVVAVTELRMVVATRMEEDMVVWREVALVTAVTELRMVVAVELRIPSKSQVFTVPNIR